MKLNSFYPLLLILALATVLQPMPAVGAKYVLGGRTIGYLTGIGVSTVLGSLDVYAVSSGGASFSYVGGGNSITALFDPVAKTMYTYTLLPNEHVFTIKDGGNILEIISVPGTLFNPSPKIYFAIIDRSGNLVDGKMITGGSLTSILDASTYKGNLVVVGAGKHGYLVAEADEDDIVKALNITVQGYENAIAAQGKVYLVGSSSTLIIDVDNEQIQEANNPTYPVIGSDAYVSYENGQVILVNGVESYKVATLSTAPDLIEGWSPGSGVFVIALSVGGEVEVYLLDTNNMWIAEYIVKAQYTQVSQLKDYYPYYMRMMGGNLVVIYSTKDSYSNMLLYLTINLPRIAEKPETVFQGSANYPSATTKSIVKITQTSNKTLEAASSTTTITTSSVQVTSVSLKDSTEKRDLDTSSINTVTATISGISITVEAPDKSMPYSDYELAGLVFTVTTTLGGVPINNVNVSLTAKIYVDNKYNKSIHATTETNNQGTAVIRLTKQDINATGDVLVKWIIAIDGYTINGSTLIKYPFQRTTTTTTTPPLTTTTTPQAGNTTTTTPTTTTGPGGGGASTTPQTTSPSRGGGGLSTGLIITVIVIVAAAAGAVIFLMKR